MRPAPNPSLSLEKGPLSRMGADSATLPARWATNCEVWAEADPGFVVAILKAGARLMLLPLGTRPSSRSRQRAYRSYPTVDRNTRLAGAIVPRRPGTMIEAETAADVLPRAPTCTGHLYPTLVPQRYRQRTSFSPRLQGRPLAYVVPAARLLSAGATPRSRRCSRVPRVYPFVMPSAWLEAPGLCGGNRPIQPDDTVGSRGS